MQTITNTVTMYLTVYRWDTEKAYHWLSYECSSENSLLIAKKDFEMSIEIPDGDGITERQIGFLEKKKENITKNNMEIKVIDEQIQSLKAIGHDT